MRKIKGKLQIGEMILDNRDGSVGQILKRKASGEVELSDHEGSIDFTIGNGNTIVPVGKIFYTKPMKYAGEIVDWSIQEASEVPLTCSAVFDVWKDTSGNYPPTVADSIAGSEKPTLTAQKLNSDTNLTSFDGEFDVGDIIAIKLESNNVGKKFLLSFKTLKS